MDARSLALQLNCRQYRDEITPEEELIAKENGLIVVFGASDDLIELRGAINDEDSAFEESYYLIVKEGKLYPYDEEEETFKKAKKLSLVSVSGEGSYKNKNLLKAIWGTKTKEGVETSWVYETEIPHSTFNIFDAEDHYCLGIVIDVKDLK